MFDVGFAELLLLSLVGLLVLGPERLPRVARTLGGMARKARSSWLSLKRSIEAEMRAEELKEPLRQFEKELKSTVNDIKSGVDPVSKPGPATTKPVPEPVPEPVHEPDGNDAG